MGNKQIRQTYINTMITGCPRKVEYWLSGRKFPSYTRLIAGTAVHEGARRNHIQKVDSEKDLPVKDIEAISVEKSNTVLKTEGYTETSDEKGRKAFVKGELHNKVVSLSRCYGEKVAGKLKPAEVEQPYGLKVGDYTITGTIDLYTLLKEAWDLKTAGVKPDKNNYRNQMMFYSLLIRASKGEYPKSLVDVVQAQKDTKKETNRPAIHHSIEYNFEQKDFDLYVKQLKMALEMIERGWFIARNDGWWCSPNYCIYHQICPYGRKA